MFKPKAQPVVARKLKTVRFIDALGKRRTAIRSTDLYNPPEQTVMLRIEFGDLKQEITTKVVNGKNFIEHTLGKFNSSKVTATIDGEKYLSTTLGEYLASKRK